jgi:outer membrane protein TolC
VKRLAVTMLAVATLAACTLAPHYQRPESPVPDRWPADGASQTAATSIAGVAADPIGWREFFADPRLQRLIEIALDYNRNLRVAVLNVAASEAQFRIQRGNLFPAISATGSGLDEKLPGNGATPFGSFRNPTGSTATPNGIAGSTLRYYNAGIGFTNYELDLFGRERSLTTEAFEQYLAQSETRRSTQISLVSEVATDYFAVLADQALVRLTQETLRSENESYELTKAMYDHDTTTLLSLRQAESVVDAARANLAQFERQLARDTHALRLVLGQEISKGSGTWSFTPNITLPIFTAGRNRGNLDLAHIEKNIEVARYELAIQTAFREVSDALNARGTYRDQRGSQEALVAADADVYSLAEVRFRSGLDSYLTTLDAQRSLYAAQLQLVVLRQAELANKVTLYKALGGGWNQHTPSRQ